MVTDSAGETPAPSTRSRDQVGTVLAERYLLEDVLGRGGMSTVYRATDSFLGRIVAIKVFRPELADADDLRRQVDEVKLLASLNHPTLVTLFDSVADAEGRAALVLEFVEGHDLRGHLDRGPLDERRTALIGLDVARALVYVHEKGIVHRDLKPGNLLIPDGTSGSHAKLADFGIARLVDGTRMTATGNLIGTAGYLSPEQALGGTIGPSSDIYSLGLVLLECLTGVRAFEGSGIESAVARLSRDPEVPESLGPVWVPLLAGMTAREPGERPAATEVADTLARIAAIAMVQEGDPTLDATLPYSALSGQSVTSDRTMPLASTTAATEFLGTTPDPAASERSPVDASPYGVPAAAARVSARLASVPRHRLVIAGAVVAALVVGAIMVGMFTAFIGPSDSTPTPAVTYPAVEGETGTHLEQLQRSVEK